MKKILLLAMIGMSMWSCSTDNEEDFVQYGYSASQKVNEQQESAAISLPTCFASLTGQVHVDVSNGIGNPMVVFTPVITGSVSATAKYRVKVEVQPLSDCDDMNSNTGTLLSFALSGTVQNVVAFPPSVYVSPASMPLCYKWRFVFEEVPLNKKPVCNSTSVWYESPLF